MDEIIFPDVYEIKLKSGEIIQGASLDNERTLHGFLALRCALWGEDQQNAVRYINLNEVEEMTLCIDTLREVGPEEIIRPQETMPMSSWDLQEY